MLVRAAALWKLHALDWVRQWKLPLQFELDLPEQ